MSIRVRLLLSYIAMILVPLALMLLTSAFAAFLFHHFEPDHADRVFNGRELEFTKGTKVLAELQYIADFVPERLDLPGDLAKLDSKAENSESGFAIHAADGTVVYETSAVKGISQPELLHTWVQNGNFNEIVEYNGGSYEVDRFTYTAPDESTKTVYFFTDKKKFRETAGGLGLIIFLGILLILALTNGTLTYLVSRSIIKPLNRLKRAAEEIKEGNLDYEIKAGRRDEIGKVTYAFEEMRIRLKESLELQLLYEENRKELISSISHDLKTPITSIKGYVEGIRDGVANSPEKVERYMETIYRKATDMDRLIDELFLFSKLDLGKVPFHFSKLDIRKFLLTRMEERRFDLEKAGIRIDYSSPDGTEPILVSIDQEQIKRVVNNIIDNSIKYMSAVPHAGEGREKRIHLRVSELSADHEIKVELADNGPGIDPGDLPHVFDRFYRADESRSTKTGGSGLGLAIVKQIIEGHGGRVMADSQLGEGTCISFTLPAPKGSVILNEAGGGGIR